MAPLLPPRSIIEVPVSDRVLGDTRIKQKARFTTLTHEQGLDGVSRATIRLVVTMYAAAGDDFGPALTAAGFSTRTVDLTAANDTLVDAATGEILAINTGQQPAEWAAIVASFPQDTMLQGDFFEYLRDHGLPGTIRQLLEHHIQQADAMGRFA